jgi:hypothetical protein
MDTGGSFPEKKTGRGVQLTTHMHLLLGLSMSGAVPTLPHTCYGEHGAFSLTLVQFVSRDSSVGTATCYELDGPGIESRGGGAFFSTRPNRPWDLPSVLYNGYRIIPGGKAAGAWS